MNAAAMEGIRVERFDGGDYRFEEHSDMAIDMRPFTSGTFEGGAVVVLLDVDGGGWHKVCTDGFADSFDQLEEAIHVLTKTRDALTALRAT